MIDNSLVKITHFRSRRHPWLCQQRPAHIRQAICETFLSVHGSILDATHSSLCAGSCPGDARKVLIHPLLLLIEVPRHALQTVRQGGWEPPRQHVVVKEGLPRCASLLAGLHIDSCLRQSGELWSTLARTLWLRPGLPCHVTFLASPQGPEISA